MHSFIYQPEYPFRLFKRVKTLHMKLREATVQPIWTVSGSQLQSWSFHYLVLWRPTLWMAPSLVPLVPVSSKPVWNAKWKWHKRCCKNHSINEGRTLSFKQFFHCTDLKLVFSSCLIPFVLKKKKSLWSSFGLSQINTISLVMPVWILCTVISLTHPPETSAGLRIQLPHS